MAHNVLPILYCLAVTVAPAFAANIPRVYSSSFYTTTSSTPCTYTEETSISSATASSPTINPSSSSDYTLVTTANPTDAPWSMSYSGYSSLPATSSAAASVSPSGVRFHPDGSSPGFYCEYPTLSEWESCNTPDSRDCWLRKSNKAKVKDRGNDYTDDDSDEINIHSDCTSNLQRTG